MYRHRRPIASGFSCDQIRRHNNISTDQLLMWINSKVDCRLAEIRQASAFKILQALHRATKRYMSLVLGEQYDSHSTIVIQSNNRSCMCELLSRNRPCHLPDQSIGYTVPNATNSSFPMRLHCCSIHRLPWLIQHVLRTVVFVNQEIVRNQSTHWETDWLGALRLRLNQNKTASLWLIISSTGN